MVNIKKLAPYVYLAKKNGTETLYNLFLLVPVDSRRTVDLDNVQPVKGPGNRIFIQYNSTEPDTEGLPSLYKYKHWEIDSEDANYADILIKGDDNDELTNLVAFADADTEPATSTEQKHTFAPYLFIGTETEGEHLYCRPSGIVLFEGNAGMENDGLTISDNFSEYKLTPGEAGTDAENPENFAINRNVRHKTAESVYTFGSTVEAYAALDKPIRKGKVKKLWAFRETNGNGELEHLENMKNQTTFQY